MAKVYDSDVDPDEFIRDFRQEPSGIGGLKKHHHQRMIHLHLLSLNHKRKNSIQAHKT